MPAEVIFSSSGNHSNDAQDTQELLLFHLNIVLNTPKNRYFTQATQKSNPIPKNPGIKTFKPKKSFDYLHHLKSQITPPPTPPPPQVQWFQVFKGTGSR